MKTNTASILLAALFAAMAALPAAAQYAGDEIDWAEKQGFGVLAGHGFVWNEIYGGGGTFAIEYVNSIVHFGLGARSGFAWGAGTDEDWDVEGSTWDSDVYIPVRLTDWLTIYGGVGITYHDCEYKGLVETQTYTKKGNTRKYTYTLKTVTYSHNKPADTSYGFGGIRIRVANHLFFFGEYHKTTGSIDMYARSLSRYSEYKTLEADFDGNYFSFGVGLLF